MSDFTQEVDLASERVGGRVLCANDEFFAPKENLVKAAAPIFIAEKYTDRGKWMDGWETRRRRTPGHDWCIVQMGLPGVVHGVVVDTRYFKGNYPEHCSMEAAAAEPTADCDTLTSETMQWTEVLPKSALRGDAENLFNIDHPYRYTHLRLKIFPDGGVARLRVHGEVVPDWKTLAGESYPDLAAIASGGRVVDCSDMFFSAPQNLLMPGKSTHMGDGWETRRRRGPGHDWVVIRLGTECAIRHLEVDTSHFKGNFPESCSFEVSCVPAALDADASSWRWQEIVPRSTLEADAVRRFAAADAGPATHLRFNIYPDGGVARLRLFAAPTRAGRIAGGLRLLNSLPPATARVALMDCCGSSQWAEKVVRERPFNGEAQLFEAADRAWAGLAKQDWLEAFSRHPQIGQRKAAAAQSAQAQQWSAQEQGSAGAAPSGMVAELAQANSAYQARFGYIFIVCATGKTMGEMLSLVKQRLNNDPEAELQIAAEEQRKITRLRLERMLAP